MFNKILIANRGEIALRVICACKDLGIRTVAVYSEADRHSLHTRFADEAICIGPAKSSRSYLDIPAVISAAEITNADAVHPGYGFPFRECRLRRSMRDLRAHLHWPQAGSDSPYGPEAGSAYRHGSGRRADPARIQGSARQRRRGFGCGGRHRLSGNDESLGGRRRTRYARGAQCRGTAASDGASQAEASAAFSNGDMYMEKLVENPRHIEFQILADNHGDVEVLGERECSIQRRHQKLIEESPSVAVNPELRQRISESLRVALKAIGYTNAGTVEFLMDADGKLYFIEVNARIQVEHPVTEMVYRRRSGEEPDPHCRGREPA